MIFKRLLGATVVTMAAAFLSACGNPTPITSGTPSPSPTITPFVSSEYTAATAGAQPSGITKGSDGGLWFTEPAVNKIGHVATDGSVTDFALPGANAAPLGITLGPDGYEWFTESGDAKIGHVNIVGGIVSEFTLPDATAQPTGITTGPDGALWITDPALNRLWRITTSGACSYYPLATAGAKPTTIAAGPDGQIWFVESGIDKLGALPAQDAVTSVPPACPQGPTPTEYGGFSAGAGLGVVASGPDNAMWVTETKLDKIARVLTNGTVAEEVTLPGLTAPFGLALGADQNFYIGDGTTDAIAQFSPTTAKVLTLASPKTKPAGIYWLTLGPDNEIYFTEKTANQVGQYRYF
ncbi:MAG: hypothetical protein KGN02_13515 [bacterium]|nr:hypothetical protein [bacterium]